MSCQTADKPNRAIIVKPLEFISIIHQIFKTMFKYFNYFVYASMFMLLTASFLSCSQSEIVEETESLTLLQEAQNVDLSTAVETENLDPDNVEWRTGSNDNFTFRTLNQALRCTDLTGALFSGHKTIYAPSDAAFKKLGLNAHNVCEELDKETLTNILLYHVVDDRVSTRKRGCVEMINGDIAQINAQNHRLFINESRIYYRFGQRGRNYSLRVFIINEVLMPPMATIAEAAGATDKFEVLFAAVLAADPAIAEALSNPDAIFTVFAPTNEAFVELLNALGVDSLEELIAAVGVEGLSTVLLYHVADTCAFSNDLKNGQEITTLQGETVKVNLDDLSIIDKTDDAAQLIPDCLNIRTANGVIHTIDKVLLPEAVLMSL